VAGTKPGGLQSKLKGLEFLSANVMGIPYRLTSAAALVSPALFLIPVPPRPVHPLNQWDPCSLWPQIDPMYKLVALSWFGAYALFTIRGLRNRRMSTIVRHSFGEFSEYRRLSLVAC
jgi:hypothetical protein